jgi:hypothetical protein
MTSIDSARWLARAIDLEPAQSMQWNAAELTAVLSHQLSAAIRGDLAKLDADLARRYDDAGGPPQQTFRQLLEQQQPDLKLLQVLKDFSKRAIAESDGSIPEELGAILYYATICVAWLRCGGARISGLNDETLQIGLNWALSQGWLDPLLCSLFKERLAQLNSTRQPRPK